MVNTFERESSPSYLDNINPNETATLSIRSGNTEMESTRLPPTECYLKHSPNVKDDPSKRFLRYKKDVIAFWTIVIILFMLTISNLILTLIIIGVLRLGKGIHGMELIPEENIIKLYGVSDLDQVHMENVGTIGGFINEPVSLTSDNTPITVGIYHRNGQVHNRLVMDKHGIQFRSINTYDIKDPENGYTIFTSHRPHYNMPKGADVLISKIVSTARISSAINESLVISTSDNRIALKGSEGIHMDAYALNIQAENNIYVNLTQGGGLTLLAESGIYLDINKIPIVQTELGLRTGSVQYKLCVCMPHGIIFRLTIPRQHNGPKISCAHFSSKHDPCTIN